MVDHHSGLFLDVASKNKILLHLALDLEALTQFSTLASGYGAIVCSAVLGLTQSHEVD